MIVLKHLDFHTMTSLFSESCTNCKKERCMKDGKGKGGKGAQKHAARKAAGGAPKQKPLAILDKVNILFQSESSK